MINIGCGFAPTCTRCIHVDRYGLHSRVCGQKVTKYTVKKPECKAFSAENNFDIDTSGDDVTLRCSACNVS